MFDDKSLNVNKNTAQNDFFNIFDPLSGGIDPARLFILKYNKLFDAFSVYVNISVDDFLKKIKEKFDLSDENFLIKDEYSKNSKVNKIDYESSTYLIEIKKEFWIEVTSFRVYFIFSKQLGAVSERDDILQIIEQVRKKKKHKKKFYMIIASNRNSSGFELRKFKVKKTDINLKENYNDDFIPVHERILEFLKDKKESGLVLLHGTYGTGKTSYIRYLMNLVNVRFIFLPSNLADFLSSPNFLSFMSKNKNSVLIMEDCDDLLTPRSSSNSSTNALFNLLNIGDGLLSDALRFKIICTFNKSVRNIDKALLRKGRLVARYEFKELSKNKVLNIWKKLGFSDVPAKDLTLADVYNKDKDNFSDQDENKVGFGKK